MSPARASWLRVVLVLLLLSLFASAGCRSRPLIQPAPIVAPLGVEENRQAILRGIALHRWLLIEEAPGLLTVKQDRRGKHVAVVDIRYDAETIAIGYKSSHGLRCQPEGDSCSTIHRAYNRWVVQLQKDIQYAVQTVRLERARSMKAL